VWNNLGPPPAPAEMEVTVMGPGYGESIVVHLGQGEWLLVDSCVDATDNIQRAAPLKYLKALGVQVNLAVKLVAVSHWDDDHVCGIAEVVEACSSAMFCCSTELTQREFLKFVESISDGATATDGGNVGQFRRVIRLLGSRNQTILGAKPGRQLFKYPVVKSWSPSDHDAMQFLNYVAQMHPHAGEQMRRAIPGSPNETSVVLSIDWEDASVLLGADMEAVSDDHRGWGAVVLEANRIGFVRGGVVKVPHHGSETAHDPRMWSDLLLHQPISVIAPFGRGPIASRPPKSSDVRRINGLSSAAFLTAKHSETKLPVMDFAVKRSLREGNIRLSSQRSTLGIVRLRRVFGLPWRHEMFGAAVRAK